MLSNYSPAIVFYQYFSNLDPLAHSALAPQVNRPKLGTVVNGQPQQQKPMRLPRRTTSPKVLRGRAARQDPPSTARRAPATAFAKATSPAVTARARSSSLIRQKRAALPIRPRWHHPLPGCRPSRSPPNGYRPSSTPYPEPCQPRPQ